MGKKNQTFSVIYATMLWGYGIFNENIWPGQGPEKGIVSLTWEVYIDRLFQAVLFPVP